MTMIFSIGDRVCLTEGADRYPDFFVPAGATGTVVSYNAAYCDSIVLEVKLDDPVPGSEEWDGVVHFYNWEDATREIASVRRIDA